MTMKISRGMLILLGLLALPAAQAFDGSELPAGAQWYVHADLAEMRGSEVGKHLHGWLEDNVFSEIRDEMGIDLATNADTVTAFSDGEQNVAVVLAARLTDDDRDKLLAVAGTSGDLEITKFRGAQYYRISDVSSPNGNVKIDGDELFFSIAERDRMVVTSDRALLEAILSGKQSMPKEDGGALLVLNADRSLMQGGLDTKSRDGRKSSAWDSNILRNARQFAFALSDNNGLAALEVRLVAEDVRMAESLGSIVRGLIGLYSLSDEANEDVSAMLASTRIDVDGNALAIRSEVEPDLAIRLLDN